MQRLKRGHDPLTDIHSVAVVLRKRPIAATGSGPCGNRRSQGEIAGFAVRQSHGETLKLFQSDPSMRRTPFALPSIVYSAMPHSTSTGAT